MTQIETRINTSLAAISRRVLDAVLPPLCMSCETKVEQLGLLCHQCWGGITFITPPLCASCGLPFIGDVEPGSLCGGCLRKPRIYQRARAALVYDDGSRRLVLGFKYGDRTESARSLARFMARAGEELLDEAEIIAPVPLHWSRLFTRRYNQSALLAGFLAKESGVALEQQLLHRHRRTPYQARLGFKERKKNVTAAFSVKPKMRNRIVGKRVLLIDDVLTTGSTAAACTKELLRNGASAVDLLTFARVVRPRHQDE